MKKTNKVLSFLLAVVMMFSAVSVSLFASAAEPEEKPVYNATFVLDMVDDVLAEQNLNKKVSLPSAVDSLLGLMGIKIDLNSINGIANTLYGISTNRLVTRLLGLFGDLKNLNLNVWKTKYTRGSDAKDAKIIGAVVNFLKDNTTIIQKFLEGNLSLGALDDVKIDGKPLAETINGVLGEDGVCGKLKGLLAGLVYEEDSAEYKACAAKALDKIIFEDLATVGIDMLLKMADDAIIANFVESENPVEPIVYLYKDLGFKLVGSLSGFKYDSSKTLDGFIADVANAVYKKFQGPLNKMIAKYGADLNTLLAEGGEYAAPFAKLFDFTKLNAVNFTAKSIVDINTFFGTIVKQICKFSWNNSANLGENLQNLFMWAIKNRDKTVPNDPYTSVTGTTFANYALALAKMIVTNVVTGEDRDTVVAKMNQCKNATEVITILLPYLLNRGDATVVASTSKTYEQVLGDIVGYYTHEILPITWKASTGIWDVVNSIVNYYLVTWNVDALLGLDLKTTDTFFQKLDKIQAVIMGDIDSVKLSTYIPALLKNILALDLKAFVKEGFEDAFANKNKDVPAAELICKIVNNLYKAVLNNDLFTFAYAGATTKAAGKLTVKCNLDGNVVATVTKAAKVNATVKLSKTSYVYTGSACKPTATVTDVNGKKLVSGTDYTLSYKNNINAGTATAVVTLKGKYSGTINTTFKITPADATKATVKLAKTAYTYTGKAIKTTATIKVGSKTLKEGLDYKLSYKNNTNVGKATVTITFIGNYKAKAKTATFTINPKGTTVSKVTPASKALTATWKKQATQTTGYEIQYSTSKNFTAKTTKTVKVTSAKTVSKKVSKLKAKTTYYVRVRTYKTVSKVNYTSAWSKAVSAKTK